MTINAWENNTEVVQPDGHKGRLWVTRRERTLIAAGKLEHVSERGSDGIHRTFDIGDLTLPTVDVDTGLVALAAVMLEHGLTFNHTACGCLVIYQDGGVLFCADDEETSAADLL